MKIVKTRTTITISLILSLLVSPLTLANRVSAATDFDNFIKPITSVEVGFWTSAPYLNLTSSSYLQYFKQHCSTSLVSSYLDAVERGNNYAVLQMYDWTEKYGYIIWQNNNIGDYESSWTIDDNQWEMIRTLTLTPSNGATHTIVKISYDHLLDPSIGCSGNTYSSSFTLANEKYDKTYDIAYHGWMPMFSTFDDLVYPDNYTDTRIEDGSSDADDDDLTLAQELKQGTSDNSEDTDGDGLDDKTESRWLVNRDEIFCHPTSSTESCAYPAPDKKDIYIEIDWMKNPDNSEVFKPTDTQLDLVKDMFDEQDINLHFDTGQYGGGTEIDVYEEYLERLEIDGTLDYLDIAKGREGTTQHFSTNREGIWRYLIYGDKYKHNNDNRTGTGWATVLDSYLFVSGGRMKNLSPSPNNSNLSVAGTIAHEIGHTLCLGKSRTYTQQSEDCIYRGIDNDTGDSNPSEADAWYNLSTYESVMNYYYQLNNKGNLNTINYSHGTNGSEDNNDWSAIKTSMHFFNKEKNLYIEPSARRGPYATQPLDSIGGAVIVDN